MYYTRSKAAADYKVMTRSKTAWKGDYKTAKKVNSKNPDPKGPKKAPKGPKHTIAKKTSKKDLEAAHILVELFHAPSTPPALERTMSHTHAAEERARPFFDQCQEGETILANYFIDQSGICHVDYYTRENGVIVLKHIREHEMVIRAMPWTYETTYFKL